MSYVPVVNRQQMGFVLLFYCAETLGVLKEKNKQKKNIHFGTGNFFFNAF